MKKIITNYNLIILCFFLSSCFHDEGDRVIILIENQSDYPISISFFKYSFALKSRILRDSINIAIKTNWIKSYSFRGKKGGSADIYDTLEHADSANVYYHNKRIAIHAFIRGVRQGVNESRDLFSVGSYTKTRTGANLFKRGDINYRYIFTNADYEVAKPITP